MVDRKLDRNWQTGIVTYPDPAIETLEEEFKKYVIFNTSVERLYTGCRWVEGPIWFGDGGYLLFSDIPNNRILKWEESNGAGHRIWREVAVEKGGWGQDGED